MNDYGIYAVLLRHVERWGNKQEHFIAIYLRACLLSDNFMEQSPLFEVNSRLVRQ